MHINKNLLLTGIMGLGIVFGSLTGCGTNNQQEKAISPNIILILADDIGEQNDVSEQQPKIVEQIRKS